MCCLRDIFLCFVCHLSNSKYNTSISGVKYSWTSLYNYHGQQNPARGENFPKSPFCPENKCFSSEDTRVEMVLFRERDTTIKLASHLHLRYSSKAERSESSCENDKNTKMLGAETASRSQFHAKTLGEALNGDCI